MIDAVVFDLDGTLVDWWTGIRAAAVAAAGETAARRLEEIAAARTRRRDATGTVRRLHWWVVEYAEDFWREVLPEGSDLDAVVASFRDALVPTPYRDALPTLLALRPGVRVGVVSNNPHAELVLERAGLLGSVDATLALEDPYRKPHPDGFGRMARTLGVCPARTVVVGDAPVQDVIGALAAGMRAVWLDRHDDGWPVPLGVPRVSSLVELPAALEALGGRAAAPAR